MDQGNVATPDELQQAINSITNSGSATTATSGAVDIAPQADDSVAEVAPEAGVASEATAVSDSAVVSSVTPETPVPAETTPIVPIETMKAQYGDPDLDKVKTMALGDLRPILEKVDIPIEKKFMIYKDILELTEDKACIEPAYNAARDITDEKARGEALIFIVEFIDKLGIQMSVDSEEE